jgi:hypothetical protein
MIINYVLAELPQRKGKLIGQHRAWLPPSALQVCQQLRAEGMRSLVKMPIEFDIDEYDMAEFKLWRDWSRMTDVNHGLFQTPYTAILFVATDGDIAMPNLLKWLKYFYACGFVGLLHEADAKALSVTVLFMLEGEADMTDEMRYVVLHSQMRCVDIDTNPKQSYGKHLPRGIPSP